MPKLKLNLKSAVAGTILVGAPIGATLGIVYGTKDKVNERQEVPAVTFGDKYFDAVIKTDRAYAPSRVFSPNGGYNLYSSYTDLIANNDTEHYMKLIKQKPGGTGAQSPVYSKNIDVSDISSIEDLDAKFLEVNDELQALSKKQPTDTTSTVATEKAPLGLLAIPTIKDSKRVIEVIAYELNASPEVSKLGDQYIKDQMAFANGFHFDMNDYQNSVDTYSNIIQSDEGYDWTKNFIQVVLSKTSPSDGMFTRFGATPSSSGSSQILQYGLKYEDDDKKGKVPVMYTDKAGVKHYVLTPKIHDTNFPIEEDKNVYVHKPAALVNGQLGVDEFAFDGQLRNANGDYDFERAIFASKDMLDKNIIPQVETSLDWKDNSFFLKFTFNKINHDSIISLSQSLDSVKNPESISMKTIRIPLKFIGKPKGAQQIIDSKISVENLLKFDTAYKAQIAGKSITGPGGAIFEYEQNSMLRQAVTKTINSLNVGTPLENKAKLYDLFRDTFLGKPQAKMLPQFSHFLKRNLVSDGLNIVGKFMPGILGPIDSFKTLIDMIDQYNSPFVKITDPTDGKTYTGSDFFRNIIFSKKNIDAIIGKLDATDGSTNGLKFIYHSIIQFGITEQRTAGILSKGTTNENDKPYIIKSSDDWLWSSVTKLSSMSALLKSDSFSLFNLYDLFAGLNNVDPTLITQMEKHGLKKPSVVSDDDSIISQVFGWASKNKVLPEGYNLQNVISDIPGTIKKLVGNLYKNNILAREDEAKGLPYKQRHNFVAFPSSLIEKLITLIPGVDWNEIKETETQGYKDNFNSFIKSASSRTNARLLKGDALKDLAKEEFAALKESSPTEAKGFPLPPTEFNSFTDQAANDKLRDFVVNFSSRYLDKISLEYSFDIAQQLKDFFRTADSSVIRGFVIPNKLPEIKPQEDVRKAAVSILGDPYTLISLIDSVKGTQDIDKFLDELLPTSSLDLKTMIPVLLKSLTGQHNLDIMAINKILNIVSRMNLLPSIADKIVTPSTISLVSGLIESGKATQMYEALKIVYGKGLYTYLKDAAGKTEFETDLTPVANAFADKLKLLTQAQKDALTDKTGAVTKTEFLDAIYDILQNGIGDTSHNISGSIKLIGDVVTNALELPNTMINVPKLVEAITDLLEDKSISGVLTESLTNTDKSNPTPFRYLFDMLHRDGSTIIYSMLPEAMQNAMDTFSTDDLMNIFDHLINGFKTESQFQQFLDFIKSLLPRDKDGKTLFDKTLSDLVDLPTLAKPIIDGAIPNIETAILRAYRNEDIAKIFILGYGKKEISTPLSTILKEGILTNPGDVSSSIDKLLHAVIKVPFYTADIWKLLPDNIKDMMTKVQTSLPDILNTIKKALTKPINQLQASDVTGILDLVKTFVPNLNIPNNLIEEIFFVLHHGLDAGAGTTSPIGAISKVNDLLGVIGSFVQIPDLIKDPIMNVLVGKDTFASLASTIAADMAKDIADNPLNKIVATGDEFALTMKLIDQYNNIIDAVDIYKAMTDDQASLAKNDVQDLVSYKAKLSDLITQAKALKQKIEEAKTKQADTETAIATLSKDIETLGIAGLTPVIETNAGMLENTYDSLDGIKHKYSEFNKLEGGLRDGLVAKAKTLEAAKTTTIDELSKLQKDLENIKVEIIGIDTLVTNFNEGVKNAKAIFDEYQAWIKDTTPTGGAYVAPHNADPLYTSIVDVLRAKMAKLQSTAKEGNVAIVQDNIKDIYKAFNAKLASDKTLSAANALKSIFKDLDSNDLKSLSITNAASMNILLSVLSDSELQTLVDNITPASRTFIYSNANTTNADKLMKYIKVTSKVNGADGLASGITDGLKGKTLDWILNNVRAGWVKRGFFHATYIGFDFFNQDVKHNHDGDVKEMNFAPIKTWTYANGDITHISANDGDKEPKGWNHILVLQNDNYHYKDFGHSHTIVDFLKHVKTKDLKWLADNDWI